MVFLAGDDVRAVFSVHGNTLPCLGDTCLVLVRGLSADQCCLAFIIGHLNAAEHGAVAGSPRGRRGQNRRDRVPAGGIVAPLQVFDGGGCAQFFTQLGLALQVGCFRLGAKFRGGVGGQVFACGDFKAVVRGAVGLTEVGHVSIVANVPREAITDVCSGERWNVGVWGVCRTGGGSVSSAARIGLRPDKLVGTDRAGR